MERNLLSGSASVSISAEIKKQKLIEQKASQFSKTKCDRKIMGEGGKNTGDKT